jgi:hypothetical protein
MNVYKKTLTRLHGGNEKSVFRRKSNGQFIGLDALRDEWRSLDTETHFLLWVKHLMESGEIVRV